MGAFSAPLVDIMSSHLTLNRHFLIMIMMLIDFLVGDNLFLGFWTSSGSSIRGLTWPNTGELYGYLPSPTGRHITYTILHTVLPKKEKMGGLV